MDHTHPSTPPDFQAQENVPENVAGKKPGGASKIGVSDPVYHYYRTFFQELAKLGLVNVVISPGGRSAVLSVLADENESLRCWVQHDERTAGFFALGLAKASRCPTALICTSGTAGANYTPAIIEAFNSGTPLLVLTADRPPEFRGKGMEQTCYQVGLFGQHLRWSYDMAVVQRVSTPVEPPPNAIELAQLAIASACSPPSGPIHINCPFEEPLEPVESSEFKIVETGTEARPSADIDSKIGTKNNGDTSFKVADNVRENERKILRDLGKKYAKGIIYVGCEDFDTPSLNAIARFASSTGWPILAEGTTNLRFGAQINTPAQSPDLDPDDLPAHPLISSGAFLFQPYKGDEFELSGVSYDGFYVTHRPDIVIRIGSTPTSKTVRVALNNYPPKELIWCDPRQLEHSANIFYTHRFITPLEDLLTTMADSTDDDASKKDLEVRARWTETWKEANEEIQKIITRRFEKGMEYFNLPTEPEIAHYIAKFIPPNSQLMLGNSSPIRDFDTYGMSELTNRIRPIANRGVNGIDGLVATALGVAAGGISVGMGAGATGGSTFLLVGDISILHDLNSLITAERLGISLTIVVVNNGGGAIFENLPLAKSFPADVFERLFVTPTDVDDFRCLYSLPGVDVSRIESHEELMDRLCTPDLSPGIHILELKTNSSLNKDTRSAIQWLVVDKISEIILEDETKDQSQN